MTLTEACKPRIFISQKWYIDTAASLQEFQQEAARRDDEEKQKKRQEYLDQLKDELEILKEADKKGVYHLINVIQEQFPPKTTNKKFKDSDKEDLVKCKEMEEYERGILKVGEFMLVLFHGHVLFPLSQLCGFKYDHIYSIADGEKTPYEKYGKDKDSAKAMKKKLLLKFLSDYHPDRNVGQDYGKKWEVLAEEITKKVTYFYECLK